MSKGDLDFGALFSVKPKTTEETSRNVEKILENSRQDTKKEPEKVKRGLYIDADIWARLEGYSKSVDRKYTSVVSQAIDEFLKGKGY